MSQATTPPGSTRPRPGGERPMRPFFVLWTGQSLSLIGSHAVQFALIWWLTERSGSATILALATLLGLLPQVVLGPVIGTLIDRWNRKAILLAADGFVALAALVLAALFQAGTADVPHVLALLFLRALGSAFHAPAMTASTTLMVPEQHFTRIQGLNQSIQGLLTIAGAPLGALLLALFPMAGVMLVDVGTAALAIVPLLAIRIPQPPLSPDGDAPGTVWADTRAGFRYLARRRGHAILIGMCALINALLVPAFSLLPLFVLERLDGGAAEFGWLSSAFGVGLTAGGIALGVWGGFRRRIVTTLAGMIALGVAVIAVGTTPGSLPWALTAMACVGITVPIVNGPVHAILQATIAPDYQGRVFTLFGSLAGAVAPLGLVLAAPVAELVGVGAWYLAGGTMCVAMGVAGFFAPALLRIEEVEAATASPEPGDPIGPTARSRSAPAPPSPAG